MTVPLDIAVRASLLLGAAALADLALRRRGSAAARHLLWSLSIAALLALPIASIALPAWPVPIPFARTPAALPAAPEKRWLSPLFAEKGDSHLFSAPVPCAPDAAGCAPAATGPARTANAPARSSLSIVTAAASVVYVAGALLLFVRLALEPFAIRRLTRTSRAVTDRAWLRTLEEAAARVGVRRPIRLLRSDRDVMPLTFGTLAPSIVLPASADDWPEDRRRAVLLHELAHVARADCLVQRLASGACALYWPHPGVWWAARRLRVEREAACDDRVLAAGAPARDYASHLLEIAHAFRAAPAPATALGMARARQLEQRLLAILDDARNRASVGRRRTALVAAGAVLLFVPMAALRAAFVPVDQASTGSAPPASAEQAFTGTWSLHPSSDPGRVQLEIRRGRSTHGRTLALADVERLAGTTLATASAVRFPIRREAGTFTIEGICRKSACAGTFAFEPDPAFAGELARRGIGRPSPQDQFHLAVADVGRAYLDALASAGYRTPDIQTLVRAAQHGVDLGYLTEMTALGYRLGVLDELTRLRDHGVDPEYIRGMTANGLGKLPAAELLRTRDHGVDPEYVGGLASLGYTGLSVEALVTARDHGVDPEYVRGMQQFGYKQSLDELRRTRDHGVDPEYVGGLASLGYEGLSIDALLGARDHGVDPEYVRGMAQLGYKGTALADLIRMRNHGVDPEYVRRLQDRGVRNLSVDEIVRRRDRGE